MYDPGGFLKEFRLEAHPEACIGTPESIESAGRKSLEQGKALELDRSREASRSFSGELLRLTPEPVPPGTPAGWRGFRFTTPDRVILGTVCGVIRDQETGLVLFVMRDTSPSTHSGQANLNMRQDKQTPFESHILVPPNGYVSPELVVGGSEL